MEAVILHSGLSKYLTYLKAMQQGVASLSVLTGFYLLQIYVLEEMLSLGSCHVCVFHLWGVNISRGTVFCRDEKGKSC